MNFLAPFENAARLDFEQDAGNHWNYWKAETPKKYSEKESLGNIYIYIFLKKYIFWCVTPTHLELQTPHAILQKPKTTLLNDVFFY